VALACARAPRRVKGSRQNVLAPPPLSRRPATHAQRARQLSKLPRHLPRAHGAAGRASGGGEQRDV